jgi:hypothetical protein
VEVTNLEANPEEMAAVLERQEIPNEVAAVHPMRAWRKEKMAYQATKECLERKAPTSQYMNPKRSIRRPPWNIPQWKLAKRRRSDMGPASSSKAPPEPKEIVNPGRN